MNTSTTSRFKSGTKANRRAADRTKRESKRAARRTLAHTGYFTWLTVGQAAAWYKVSESTIRRRVGAGKLTHKYEGKTLLIRRDPA